MSQDKYFHEAHFCSLSSQSNVYGMTKVKSQVDKSFKILVSSGKAGQITCIGFQRNKTGVLEPISKELGTGDLSIPDGSELLSLDAFLLDGVLLLGFCFTKDDNLENNTIQWLNAANIISTQLEPRAEFCVTGLMQGFSTIDLEFGCLFLKHKSVKHHGMSENLCLMSGNDAKVHAFTLEREDFGNTIKYCSVSCDVFFPELSNLKSCVICLDFLEFEDKRVTVIGCDNGAVIVSLVDLTEVKILESWITKHDHPILVVKLFSDVKPQQPGELTVCHLLASSVTTTSVVYRNVLKDGFTNVNALPNSDKYDLVMCACLADIDWDGEKELLLGTNGHQLLAYKWVTDEKDIEGIEPLPASPQESIEEEDDLWLPVEEYRLIYERRFTHSLMGIEYVDVTGDGLSDLVILCTDGIRILQHNLDKAQHVLIERLKKSKMMEDSKE